MVEMAVMDDDSVEEGLSFISTISFFHFLFSFLIFIFDFYCFFFCFVLFF